MESLETLALRQLLRELHSNSSNFGQTPLPGIINSLLSPDQQEKAWEIQRQHHQDFSIYELRPFFLCYFITSISLFNVTDELAREITPVHFPNLSSLTIASSPRLTDRGLHLGIRKFETLARLEFQKCPGISLAGVAACSSSESLVLRSSVGKVGNLQAIDPVKFVMRKHLFFEGSDPGLEAIPDILKVGLTKVDDLLEEITIRNNTKVNDEVANALSGQKKLRKIEISFAKLTKQALYSFSSIKTLEELDLAFSSIVLNETEIDAMCHVWRDFRKLRNLDLSGADFGDDVSGMFLAIAQCPQLETFYARFCKLNFKPTNNAGFLELFCKLVEFDLVGNKNLSDEAFINNQFLTFSVQKLNLSGTAVMRPPVLNASSFPNLTQLIIESPNLASDFVYELLTGNDGMHLSTISLKGCGCVNDHLLRIIVRGPTRLRDTLHHLDLTSVCSSGAAIKALQKEYPEIEIIPRYPTPSEENKKEEAKQVENFILSDVESESSDDSDLEESALRHFIRGVTRLNGRKGPSCNQTDESSLSSSVESREASFTEDDVSFQHDLLELCCTCADCAVVHPRNIQYQKQRYSKEELLKLRPTKQDAKEAD